MRRTGRLGAVRNQTIQQRNVHRLQLRPFPASTRKYPRLNEQLQLSVVGKGRHGVSFPGSHRFKKGIGAAGVKDLVAGHDRDQLLRVAEIDDAVGPAGDHVHRLDALAGNGELHGFAGGKAALTDERRTVDHDEQLPLAIVPVLALGDARAGNIHAHLPAVGGLEQFGEAAPLVGIHPQAIFKLLRREIGEVEGIELLGKGAVGHFRHEQRFRLGLELR